MNKEALQKLVDSIPDETGKFAMLTDIEVLTSDPQILADVRAVRNDMCEGYPQPKFVEKHNAKVLAKVKAPSMADLL